MKNAPDLELSLVARQWGATAVPFGELTPESWLESPPHQRALRLLNQTAALRSVLLLAGPTGVGKSALIGRRASGLDRRLFCPLFRTLLADHPGYPTSICKHGFESQTVFSIIIQLDTLKAWIGRGHACETEYTEYQLEPYQ